MRLIRNCRGRMYELYILAAMILVALAVAIPKFATQGFFRGLLSFVIVIFVCLGVLAALFGLTWLYLKISESRFGQAVSENRIARGLGEIMDFVFKGGLALIPILGLGFFGAFIGVAFSLRAGILLGISGAILGAVFGIRSLWRSRTSKHG